MKNYRCMCQSPLGMIEIEGSIKGIHEICYLEQSKKRNKKNKLGIPFEIRKCRRQLSEYFRGQRKEFHMKLVFEGTEFQNKVWNELCNVPYGETASYKDIAEKIDNPNGVRAVGGANNKNKLAIVVPCHRVIGKNGKLTGYAGGIWRKEWLLSHEHDICG